MTLTASITTLTLAAVGFGLALRLLSTLRNDAEDTSDLGSNFLGADQGGGFIHLGSACMPQRTNDHA